MKCPADGYDLVLHLFDSIDHQECPQCHGLWFGADSFRKAKDRAEPDLNWVDFDLWRDTESLVVEPSTRKCPVCQQTMASINYPKTNTRIEYCPKEHGVWLDKGEFETIVKSLENEIETMHLPEYVHASVKEAREVILGKEGFISEWKDFWTVMRLLQYRILVDNPKFAKTLADFQSTFHF